MEMKHTESHLQEGALEAWCTLQRGMTGLTPQLLLIPQTQHCSCFEDQTGNQDGAPESCSHFDLLKGSCASWHCLSSTDVCAYPNPSCSPSHPLLPPSVPGVTTPHCYSSTFLFSSIWLKTTIRAQPCPDGNRMENDHRWQSRREPEMHSWRGSTFLKPALVLAGRCTLE